MALVDAVLQPRHRAQLVDDVVARLVQTPPELLRKVQLQLGLRDGVADRQPVAQIGLRVELRDGVADRQSYMMS